MIAQSAFAPWARAGGRCCSPADLCGQGGMEVVQEPLDVTHSGCASILSQSWLCHKLSFSQFNIKDFPSGAKGAGWKHPSLCKGWPFCKVCPQHTRVGIKAYIKCKALHWVEQPLCLHRSFEVEMLGGGSPASHAACCSLTLSLNKISLISPQHWPG